MADQELMNKIAETVKENKIVLFIKGTPEQPMCGFSAQTLAAFQNLKVPFAYSNVLDDENIRQGIKDFSNWPTIPQVYIDGEFVGGNDIIQQLYASGELEKMVQ